MESNSFFKFLVNNPIFLGGNALIYVKEYINENREEIIKSAKRTSTTQNTTFH